PHAGRRLPRHPPRAGGRAVVTVAALLRPRVLAARNVTARHPRRMAVGGLAVAALWGGCLAAAVHMIGYFQTIGEFGPALTQRLLILVFAVLLGILVLSATIAALQTFYLASDVSLLLATPV